jgi:hypothetical protein
VCFFTSNAADVIVRLGLPEQFQEKCAAVFRPELRK